MERDKYCVVYVDGWNAGRSEYPLEPGYYIKTRGLNGSWAIHDRTRYETEEDAEYAAEAEP